MKLRKFFWPVVGSAAVVFSIWLLYHELRGVSLEEMKASFARISLHSWLLAILSTFVAYGALAGYDNIALKYLNRKVPWLFITIGSFTTYAISHNVGASVLSGAVVRYRAYGSKGLTMAEVGILVAFCSFTFALGVVFLTGLVFVIEPEITDRFVDILPTDFSLGTGYLLLGLVALYVLGSLLKLPPLRIKGFSLGYPSPAIVARQLVIGPIEIIGAAGIVYFALPEAGNPGFLVILGIFLISFSVALLSHAPGGLGVLELVFVHALSEMDPADVIAALVVFRLLYLIIPFVIALVVILLFERSRFGKEDG
ncbi:YbhN family protein [Mesorhizobium sp. J428]|uniref:lysylphosphatidylglycerol synthase transmembrane domain-containing protein n=1 Tax=Mesorhizobium sp. J428 TaxID=2898440 RepID=UPI002150B58E|nr:YbhN family protein [Mesorhizobium sp. J428]MCR5857863.1 lysylphosphatidylglycerol synthase domain-containing protein [Mesorhizobium sp. J428]